MNFQQRFFNNETPVYHAFRGNPKCKISGAQKPGKSFLPGFFSALKSKRNL